jgi:hypothetical protein
MKLVFVANGVAVVGSATMLPAGGELAAVVPQLGMPSTASQ